MNAGFLLHVMEPFCMLFVFVHLLRLGLAVSEATKIAAVLERKTKFCLSSVKLACD
jgi:hypothetical protein